MTTPPTRDTSSTGHATAVPSLAWALAGGWCRRRGFAMTGVIQVLEEAGIRPGLGCRSFLQGSLVAAVYASGRNGGWPQLRHKPKVSWKRPPSPTGRFRQLSRGMPAWRCSGAHVKSRQVGGRSIGIPDASLCWHCGHGIWRRFQHVVSARRYGTAVRASRWCRPCSSRFRISGRDYVDGGWYRPRRFVGSSDGAELVVAVDISSPPEGNIFRQHTGCCC